MSITSNVCSIFYAKVNAHTSIYMLILYILMYAPTQVMELVKRGMDPLNILNPDKVLDSSYVTGKDRPDLA